MKNETLKTTKKSIKLSVAAFILASLGSPLFAASPLADKDLQEALKATEAVLKLEDQAKRDAIEREKLKKAPIQKKQKTQEQLDREAKAKAKIALQKEQIETYAKHLEDHANSIVAQAFITNFSKSTIGETTYKVDQKTLDAKIVEVQKKVLLRKKLKFTAFFAKQSLKSDDKNTLSQALNQAKQEYTRVLNETPKPRSGHIQGDKVEVKNNTYVAQNIYLKILEKESKIVIFNKGAK